MIKKGTILFLLLLLVSLPGCGRRKKERGEYGRGRTMAQKDDFKSVNIALANEEGLEVDAATQKFFMDEINQFVNLEDSDFDLVKKDEFAWQAAGDQGQLETVYFGFNKNKIDKVERTKVERNVDKAKQLLTDAGAGVKLVIEGHACASAGSDAYNMALSQQRAAGVKSDLVAAGIPFDKVTSVGRGNEMLVVKDGGREEQAPNRRVEMHIIRG